MLIDDSRPSAFIAKQKTFILNAPGELNGRITLTHKVASASFTTINASALVHPEDALGMFTYHTVLIDAPEDDLYINMRPAAGIQSITAYLAWLLQSV
ncbi:hypothetical protein DPMN_135423 [Dreissena polymorpha]|uniref:Uncharacterized protein n=1 Tax=Dreissena polymorpha TaxID=45954 RepID=A0A9D4G1V8_DREPO|nr:hypothetical protein DPMN_135423 [Dreissena polymorpha]